MKTSRLLLVLTLLATSLHAETIEMTVNGLVCGFCAQGIEKTLRKNPATQDVLVSLENRLVAIVTKDGADIPDTDLRKALTDAGYDVKSVERTQRSIDDLRSTLKVKK
ncbi:MAG TPA: heavy-metal-associated domain-containing protein [Steroidobacter sp.]